jgi:hypothetical protein
VHQQEHALRFGAEDESPGACTPNRTSVTVNVNELSGTRSPIRAGVAALSPCAVVLADGALETAVLNAARTRCTPRDQHTASEASDRQTWLVTRRRPPEQRPGFRSSVR